MNIKTWLLIVSTLALWPCQIAIAANNDSASAVLSVQKKWNDAYKRGDVVTMNALLSDDYIITVEDGNTFSKPGYIARNGNSTVHVHVSKMSNLKVRVHGNTAVVTGAYYEKGTEKGKPYEYRDRLTDVWMNTNGRWQLIVSHYSTVNQ